jgi:hypothetical protein
MRTLRLRVTSFIFALVLATALSPGIARACSDVVIGSGWSCELSGEDASYCYYNCECHGISETTCANRLGLAGFEIV